MTPGPFHRFIAIDWSGAKTAYARKLCVAVCEAGDAAPSLVEVEGGWTRESIAQFILDQPAGTLTGFDFSFAPPFMDAGSYLPRDTVPDSGPAFWSHVEAVCADDPDCGAHSFVEGAYRNHFYLGKADGDKAAYMRWRRCETAFNAAGGGKAACVFDAIGAAQVSKASFAGMRVLHRLREGGLSIWPFQKPKPAQSVVVELYCRAFIQHAGMPGRKLRDLAALNAALAGLSSQAYAQNTHAQQNRLTDDQTDALVASAGLRAFAHDAAAWAPDGLNARVSETEGWTFGVF